MLTKTLAATAALSMLVGGGSALAQSKSAAAVGPKQPIPYSQLNAYMKASPKARASKDWWTGSASAATGMSTDTSATAPSSTMSGSTDSSMTGSSMGAMGSSTTGVSSSTDTSVNPAPSLPSTPPTDAGAMPPATPSDPTTPPAPPTEPK